MRNRAAVAGADHGQTLIVALSRRLQAKSGPRPNANVRQQSLARDDRTRREPSRRHRHLHRQDRIRRRLHTARGRHPDPSFRATSCTCPPRKSWPPQSSASTTPSRRSSPRACNGRDARGSPSRGDQGLRRRGRPSGQRRPPAPRTPRSSPPPLVPEPSSQSFYPAGRVRAPPPRGERTFPVTDPAPSAAWAVRCSLRRRPATRSAVRSVPGAAARTPPLSRAPRPARPARA